MKTDPPSTSGSPATGIVLMTTLISEDYPEIIEFFKSQNFEPARMKALELRLVP